VCSSVLSVRGTACERFAAILRQGHLVVGIIFIAA